MAGKKPTRKKKKKQTSEPKSKKAKTKFQGSSGGSRTKSGRSARESGSRTTVIENRPGAGAAGQSGDTQALSANATASPESVKELIEEGQAFEAEVVDGVENAADADEAEVRTKEVPEDDVPRQYQEKQ
jgi:hypothetical protein